jgi:hypothetical protein
MAKYLSNTGQSLSNIGKQPSDIRKHPNYLGFQSGHNCGKNPARKKIVQINEPENRKTENMIVKPSVSFLKNHADAKLIVTTGGILSAMTGNPHFPSPSPTLPVLASALNDFSTALANAADGGKALTAAKKARRAALAVLLRELAAYLQVACKGDLTALVSSGFPNHKPHRQPVGALPAPANVTITFGHRTGELSGSFSPVAGASAYNWRVTTATEPEVAVLSVQSTAASNTFTGLTPGVVYRVQANAVGAAGPSDWSVPVPQMVV